jgi:hypothetical protein
MTTPTIRLLLLLLLEFRSDADLAPPPPQVHVSRKLLVPVIEHEKEGAYGGLHWNIIYIMCSQIHLMILAFKTCALENDMTLPACVLPMPM